MSYLVPFQGVELFERTFKHQINKTTGNVDEREFVFNKRFGDGADQLPLEANRYRLIWYPGCPYSNKAVITLRLLGLDRVISVGEGGIIRDPRGWVFSEDLGEVDPVLKIHYLDDAYLKGKPDFVGRSTVPAIADITTGAIVQNEANDIPKYLVLDWKKYHKENAPDLYPEDRRAEIDESTNFILDNINAYRCGFARSQETYDRGYARYFKALEELEERLATRRFVDGDYITLSDLHLYVALIRFHLTYHFEFGVNKKRLQDYPNLWGYVRDLYAIDAFYDYTKLELIKRHYQQSPHLRAKFGNVYGLVGTGPDNRDLLVPTGRESLSRDPEHKFIYEREGTRSYDHSTVEGEIEYLNQELIFSIEKAGASTFQTDLERWAHCEADVFKAINERLATSKFLLGEEPTEADKLLYQTLLRHDHIYYYIYHLNYSKTYDFANIARFLEDATSIKGFTDSIDIVAEKEKAFLELEDDRNPYHIAFRGPAL